jgi:hypothetical protein
VPSPIPCRQITKITSATGETASPTDNESRLIEHPTIARRTLSPEVASLARCHDDHLPVDAEIQMDPMSVCAVQESASIPELFRRGRHWMLSVDLFASWGKLLSSSGQRSAPDY